MDGRFSSRDAKVDGVVYQNLPVDCFTHPREFVFFVSTIYHHLPPSTGRWQKLQPSEICTSDGEALESNVGLRSLAIALLLTIMLATKREEIFGR